MNALSLSSSKIVLQLHEACGSVVLQSTTGEHQTELGKRFSLQDEMSSWNEVLTNRPEITLYRTAQTELVSAFLSVCQGRYRSAFKSLRLTLELYLQGIFLSVDEIATFEWLNNHRDTNWNAIVNADTGIYSSRFCRAFFADLDDKRKIFELMARTLYRELSECTHGNVPSSIVFSDQIDFSPEAFGTFLSKCDILRIILHFTLSMRFLRSYNVINLGRVETVLLEELGHISPVRIYLGGTE